MLFFCFLWLSTRHQLFKHIIIYRRPREETTGTSAQAAGCLLYPPAPVVPIIQQGVTRQSFKPDAALFLREGMWQYPVKVIVRRPPAALPAAVILAVRRSPYNGCDGRRTMNPVPVLYGKKDAGADTFSLSGGRKMKSGPPHDAMALIHYRRIIIILV